MPPTPEEQAKLAELPFLVLATALACDAELTDEEVAAAQHGLSTLQLRELMVAIREAPHSATELFELAWLEDDAAAALAERVPLLSALFGEPRAIELRQELFELARLVSKASDRRLRAGEADRVALLGQVQRALDSQ